MLSNKSHSSLWPCLHSKQPIPSISWNIACFLCRLGGVIILFLSIICFIFNIRYFRWYKQRRYRNRLVLSLFLASFFVLIISVPTVLTQVFTCHRHCSEIFCRMEGFTSYFGGCLCMLVYMNLSITRYLSLCQYKSLVFDFYSTIISWIMTLAWTLPPVFDYGLSYAPEGLGFHCSINWDDHSKINFYYILSSFVGMYFLPLIVLLVVNVRVHQIIRNAYSFPSCYYCLNEEISNQKIFSFLKQQKSSSSHELDNRSSITSTYVKKAADRKRLRIEYRLIQAIVFLVSIYIFAWTPYSISALLQLFHVDFIFEHAFLITLSAFIAKLSVICTPFVYLCIMNNRVFKKILF